MQVEDLDRRTKRGKLYQYFTAFKNVLNMLLADHRLKREGSAVASAFYLLRPEAHNPKKAMMSLGPDFDPQTYIDMKFEEFLDHREEEELFTNRFEFSFRWAIFLKEDSEFADEVYLVEFLPADPGKQVNTATVRNLVESNLVIDTELPEPQQVKYNRVIIITENGIGGEAYRNLQALMAVEFEFYLDKQFCIDARLHVLSPITTEHIPSSKVPSWEREESISSKLLPYLGKNDALAVAHRADVGDVIVAHVVGAMYDVRVVYYRVVGPVAFEPVKELKK